jgi:hypothetical protein
MQTINELLLHKKNKNAENNEKLPWIPLWNENESDFDLLKKHLFSFVESQVKNNKSL